MNLAVFEDIRDVSPRQGWVPTDLVSAWVSEALNPRYEPVTLSRYEGVIFLPVKTTSAPRPSRTSPRRPSGASAG
jgi:hypothetical protein